MKPEPEIAKQVAERVLLASDILMGYRCPACHGKPAVNRYRSGAKKRYVCGCGHQWDPLTRSGEFRASFTASPSALLKQILETGQLPDLPAKLNEPAPAQTTAAHTPGTAAERTDG